MVLEVDRSTPPILFHHGEGFRTEKLPAGRSRVIYPAEPLLGLADPEGAIRRALLNPIDQDPLPAQLRPGMKLTIAFDDISLPLPPMRRPDIRQMVIEQVLEMAAAAGVDDVHIIAALALHRRMTEDELRYCLGDRTYDAFAPSGCLYNHDAEDPDGMVVLGTTPHGEEVQFSKRAAESDLVVYVNINLVAMDGGHKSTATGLAGYQGLRHHHNVKTMQESKSFMDQHRSELHASNWRMGKVLRDSGVKIFQIETTVNNNTFGVDGPLAMLQKREWEWTAKDRAAFVAMTTGLKYSPPQMARQIFQSWRAPYELTSVQAGEVEAVHKVTTENVYAQHLVPVEGQTDILTMGLPYICPYNVNSVMNPILVMCLGLGYFFNLYRGRPLVREGGVVIMGHPPAGSSTRYTTPATSTSSSRSWPTPPTPSRSRLATSASSPRTSGTSTCTARRTPTTASTPSTCGTGGRTPFSTWVKSSSWAATPGPYSAWASAPHPPSKTPSRSPATRWAASPPSPTFTTPPS